MSMAQPIEHPPLTANNRRIAAWLIAGAMLMWIVITYLAVFLPDTISIPELIWIRYGTQLLFMAAIGLPRLGLAMFKTKRPGMQLGRGLVMLLMLLSYLISFRFFDFTEIWTGFWIGPIIVVAGGFFLLREKFNPLYLVLVVAGYLGAMLILKPTAHLFSPGLLFPMLMAVSYAIYVIMTKRMVDEPVDTNLFYTALVIFLVLTPFIPSNFTSPSFSQLMVMMIMGVGQYFMLLLLELAIVRAPVSYIAPFLFTSVIWAIIASVLSHQFHPNLWTMVGVVLLVGALLILYAMPGHMQNKLSEAALQKLRRGKTEEAKP